MITICKLFLCWIKIVYKNVWKGEGRTMSNPSLIFEYVPRRRFVFFVKLHEIQYSELQKENNAYRFLYEDKALKVDITFKKAAYSLISDNTPFDKKNKTLKQLPVVFRKHRKGYLDFIYELGLSAIDKHDFKNGPFTIKLENKLFSIFIILKLTKKGFANLLKKAKDEYSQKNDGRTIVRVSSETKLDSFDKDINSNKKQSVAAESPYSKNSLAKYGIYLTHPNAFKRCFNCANYNEKECTAFKRVEVSENHSCKRFYSYRTYLGGGFSPR
jgi:hypothetical protein